jgi:hypothetical protein
MQVRDKKNRVKKTLHVGVYKSIEDLEIAKIRTLASNPNVTFEVYPCEHILFEQQPDRLCTTAC